MHVTFAYGKLLTKARSGLSLAGSGPAFHAYNTTHCLRVVRPKKLLQKIRAGQVENVRFRDFIALLRALGFVEAGGRGGHRRFAHPRSRHMVIQTERGFAKGYQVRQLLALIDEYNLTLR